MTEPDFKPEVFTFERDFDQGTTVPHPIGRIKLAVGSIRLYFAPQGVIAVVSKSALDQGALTIWDDYTITGLTGLGKADDSA